MGIKVTDGVQERTAVTLINAIEMADRLGQGYKVYEDGTLVYEQITPYRKIARSRSAVLSIAKEMTDTMSKIKDWFYSNHGVAGSLSAAIRKKLHKSNCATLANWILRKLKVTGTGQYVYGKTGGIMQCSDETLAALKEKCDVFPLGLTVEQAIKLDAIRPGDICLYTVQHTNIYAGGKKWYESGTVYADGSGSEGTILRKFYGSTALPDHVIAWVIRYNDPAYRVKGREYRVQCGTFTVKKNAKAVRSQLSASGVTAILVKECGEWVVQTGRFSILDYAVRQYMVNTGLEFPCMIKGI